MDNNICAGIVTYNPDLELFSKCFNSLEPQVDKVIIFDNGSKNIEQLSDMYNNRAEIIQGSRNFGIAKALNELCKQAEVEGYEWILTMDQDSICNKTMVHELEKHIDNPQYAIIAPRVEFRAGSRLIHETKNENEEIEKIRACITSGSLTRISAWKKCGGFDEWMFIDHVDNEFCTHLLVEGYFIVRTNKALLLQRAGNMKYKRLPGGKVIMLSYYSEKRNYYICRNTVYYLRKYREHINYRHELGAFIYSQTIKILFESNKSSSIRSTIKGIRDGISKSL